MTSYKYKVIVEYIDLTGAEKTYEKITSAASPATAVKRVLKFAPRFVSENYRDSVIIGPLENK